LTNKREIEIEVPELPEVETVKKGLEPVILGQTIKSCALNVPALRLPFGDDFIQTVTKAKFIDIIRRGKYIITQLSNDHALIWHLGMSGRIKIFNNADEYSPQKHDHVVFILSNKARIVFHDPRRFGFIRLVPNQDLDQIPPFNRMGPEPLPSNFDAPALRRNIARKKKSSIKDTLLDQSVVAGIGNIYASEALYGARINPLRHSGTLKKDEAGRLVDHIKAVLQKAILAGGSTLRDYAQTDGSAGYFQHQFSVYDRQGQACPDCSCVIAKTGGIQRVVQSGRSTYFCSKLQK
jgi:formamidopyrimidine-DNA glycosylase